MFCINSLRLTFVDWSLVVSSWLLILFYRCSLQQNYAPASGPNRSTLAFRFSYSFMSLSG